MKFEEPRWACSIPARPSITPSEFCVLVKERATTSTPSECTDGNNRSSHEHPEARAGIQLRHTVPEYLEAFRSLHVTPRPCKHWLGSKWQRQLADLVIEQKNKKPDEANAQQGSGATNEGASAKSEKCSGPSTVGMSQAFMDQLKTRRRDELKKAQEKAAEERREQERLARINEKVLEVKQQKLDSLNRERAAECTLARQQLDSNIAASQALAARLESVNQTLKSVEVDKHNAVTRLKAKRAEQSSGAQVARMVQPTADAHALATAVLASSNGTASAKPAVGDAPTPQTDSTCKQEGQQHSATTIHATKSEGAEGATVLALGVVVNPPAFPPPSGFIVPRLFELHEEIGGLQTPREECGLDLAAKAGAQKRKREDEKAQPAQNKTATAPTGFLPPPQPLSSNTAGGKSTLPPAPNTNVTPGNQPRKVKRSEPPGPGPWPNRNGCGRFPDDPRPRHHGSDVFGGVRGSSGHDKRSETGSFIGRPAVPGHSQGFLPRVVPEEGDDLLSGRPGLASSKGVGVMAEGLKPLPTVGPSGAMALRGNFLDQQPHLLPPPPIHSMKSSHDVPPPPAWNFGPRIKKEGRASD